MATTPQGVYYPVPLDAYDPPGDMQKLAEAASRGLIVPVTNVAERDALAALVMPTADTPLYVHRADITAGSKLEYTTDGTNWVIVGEQPVWDLSLNTTLDAPSGQWVHPSTNWTRDRYNGAALPTLDGRVTIPMRGLYAVTLSAWFNPHGTGRRMVGAGLNGANPNQRFIIEGPTPNSVNTVQIAATVNRILNAGDELRLMIFQDSGGHLGIRAGGTSMTINRLSGLR